MLLTHACFGLAIVETSAQNYQVGGLPPTTYDPLASIPSPEIQYQPLPGIDSATFDPLASIPLPEMQYQPLPDMQMMYQQVPDMQMLYETMPSTDFPLQPEFPVMANLQAPPVTKPDDGSEECQAQQAANPLHTGMSVLEQGRVYCAQAADSRWWDVVVKSRNCDGSYAVAVKDDVSTEWPVAQRAYFLDKPCNDFYRDVLMEEGLSEEEIKASLHNQGFKEDGQSEDQSSAGHETVTHTEFIEKVVSVDTVDMDTQKTDRWPVSEKKFPVKVVAAAAAAGAVPLVYTLSGS